ncbi:transcriptional repressor [Galbibacter sp. EGI 63066]|uniref:Fur family transcriptional regulator n=1 Tax=Galbibacter sp. EGI 63066 TaxID=2993559 RepID=UPI00224892C6|nr:transcriptional repressor [Galbibacter sp. EGI 63066]MCX2679134.1 transcriptional repressor [Galbibacter sp. EGI 63066]
MEKVENILKTNKVRPTAMRLLIYNYLTGLDEAVGLTDIENAFLEKEGLSMEIDRTTLYRTIKTFQQKGLVHAIEDGTGTTKYALCESDCSGEKHNDLHLHFFCNDCKKTVCLTDHKIPKIELPRGYEAEQLDLLIKGVCDLCQPD